MTAHGKAEFETYCLSGSKVVYTILDSVTSHYFGMWSDERISTVVVLVRLSAAARLASCAHFILDQILIHPSVSDSY
jgi:hypothetical protein